VIEAIVRDGPGVDGVSLRREATIDAVEMKVHREILEAVLETIR
jgi:D-glutamate cyclase